MRGCRFTLCLNPLHPITICGAPIVGGAGEALKLQMRLRNLSNPHWVTMKELDHLGIGVRNQTAVPLVLHHVVWINAQDTVKPHLLNPQSCTTSCWPLNIVSQLHASEPKKIMLRMLQLAREHNFHSNYWITHREAEEHGSPFKHGFVTVRTARGFLYGNASQTKNPNFFSPCNLPCHLPILLPSDYLSVTHRRVLQQRNDSSDVFVTAVNMSHFRLTLIDGALPVKLATEEVLRPLELYPKASIVEQDRLDFYCQYRPHTLISSRIKCVKAQGEMLHQAFSRKLVSRLWLDIHDVSKHKLVNAQSASAVQPVIYGKKMFFSAEDFVISSKKLDELYCRAHLQKFPPTK